MSPGPSSAKDHGRDLDLDLHTDANAPRVATSYLPAVRSYAYLVERVIRLGSTELSSAALDSAVKPALSRASLSGVRREG